MAEPIWLWSTGESSIKQKLRHLKWNAQWTAICLSMYTPVPHSSIRSADAPHP